MEFSSDSSTESDASTASEASDSASGNISTVDKSILGSVEDHRKERSARMKRNAEDQLQRQNIKSARLSLIVEPTMDATPAYPSAVPQSQTSIDMAYLHGGLRITRTPGRRKEGSRNCVSIEDVISGDSLLSACIFSFFIAEDEIFKHLPLSRTSEAVPIYIGRDVNLDPMAETACQKAGINSKKLSKTQLASITSQLESQAKKQYGKNYHAFYAWSPGSSHSKIMVLMYSTFLRVVITSCNMMETDIALGDNHWYIHDLPMLASHARYVPSTFEQQLLAHLRALGTPEAFIDSIQDKYDYSSVKVQLVTSVPGTCAGSRAENHGLLRLRRVIQDLVPSLSEKRDAEVQLEVCAASLGNLSAKWLTNFYDCALGKKEIRVTENSDVPNLKIFFPTVQDVKSANEAAQDAASNIGCHIRPWDQAPTAIKRIFHHYESKDRGCLFHQKLIISYNPEEKTALPYYVYVGSANLSQSAWGALETDKKSNAMTCDTKIVKLTNFECGVVIPGNAINALLEHNTKWVDIIPFVQSARRYTHGDKPWNDPRWVPGYQEDWKGSG